MKINPIINQAVLGAYKPHSTKSPQQSFQATMDQVSLSEEVVSFSSTISKMKEQMDVRTPAELAHIQEISMLISSGRYHVGSEKVAAKMVDEFMG